MVIVILHLELNQEEVELLNIIHSQLKDVPVQKIFNYPLLSDINIFFGDLKVMNGLIAIHVFVDRVEVCLKDFKVSTKEFLSNVVA